MKQITSGSAVAAFYTLLFASLLYICFTTIITTPYAHAIGEDSMGGVGDGQGVGSPGASGDGFGEGSSGSGGGESFGLANNDGTPQDVDAIGASNNSGSFFGNLANDISGLFRDNESSVTSGSRYGGSAAPGGVATANDRSFIENALDLFGLDFDNDMPPGASLFDANGDGKTEVTVGDFFDGALGFATGGITTAVGLATGYNPSDVFGGFLDREIGTNFGLAENDGTAQDIGATGSGRSDSFVDTLGKDDMTDRGSRVATRQFEQAKPDLIAIARRAVAAGNDTETEFIGEIQNVGPGAASLQGGLRTSIKNNLLIDYGCDGTVDLPKQFDTEIDRINANQIIRLSDVATLPVTSGDEAHCFVFEADVDNQISEVNETNNRAAQWVSFTVADAGSPDTSADGQDSSTNTDSSSDSQNTNDTTATEADDIELMVRLYEPEQDENGTYVPYNSAIGPVYYPATGYQTANTLAINEYNQLVFKWSAPNYDTCVSGSFNTNGDTVGDTEFESSYDLGNAVFEPAPNENRTYTLSCSGSNGTGIKSMTIGTVPAWTN